MKRRLLLAGALLLAAHAAMGASNTMQIASRYVIPSGAGNFAIFEADLNGNGASQIVTDGLGTVGIFDPNDGYRVIGQLDFAPKQLAAIAALPNPGGLPARFVTVSWNPAAQGISGSATIDTWTGSPPQRIDSFDVAVTPNANVSGIENLDGDAALELVFHGYSASLTDGLQIVDLATHHVQATAATACQEIQFVVYGAGPGKKILCTDPSWQQVPPRIVDGSTGSTLFDAPAPLGRGIAAGAIHSTTADELVVYNPQTEYLQHVDLSAPWLPTDLLFDGGHAANDDQAKLVDSDHDGIDEYLVYHGPYGVELFATADMSLLGGFDFNKSCGTPFAVGYFDHGPDLKIFCSGDGYYSAVVRTFDANAAPLWGVRYDAVAPSPPAVGHVTAGGEEDLVALLQTQSTPGLSTLLVLDGKSLGELSRTDVDAGTAVALTRNKLDPRQDIIIGGGTKIEKIVPGNATPEWTDTVPQYLAQLAPNDIDADGQDEVVAVNYSYEQVSGGGFLHQRTLCDVQTIDTANGAVRWSLPAPIQGVLDAGRDIAMTTIQIDAAGAKDVVVACGGTVRALHGATGATRWEIAANATAIVPVVRDGAAQLLLADAAHIERRDPAGGQPLAALSGNATAVVDLGSDDNLVVRQGDGTLRRFDAVHGVSWDGPSPIGDNAFATGLVAGAASSPGSAHVFANTNYGFVRVELRTDASIFTDGFEAPYTP